MSSSHEDHQPVGGVCPTCGGTKLVPAGKIDGISVGDPSQKWTAEKRCPDCAAKKPEDTGGIITERRYLRVQFIEVIASSSEESDGVTIQTDGSSRGVWIAWDEMKELLRVLQAAVNDMRPDIADEQQRDRLAYLKKLRDGETT